MATDRTPSRPKRTPLGQRNRLSFGKQDPNYVYRVINDQDERLLQAQEAGYEFVTGNEQLGDKRAAEGGKIDSRISKPGGNGVRGFLMRIPKEFYEEDQNAKIGKIEEVEKALKKPSNTSVEKAYGEGLTNT
jgi:hypothetical protein